MRWLVTGASGHIGSFVVRRLLREGEHVIASARAASDLWRIEDVLGSVELVHLDLATIGCGSSPVAGARPDIVVHTAWAGITASSRDDPAHVAANVGGSLSLVHQAAQGGCGVFIGLGSQAEYGSYDEPLREDLEPHPDSLYGAAKLCTGELTRRLCASLGVRCVWLRLTASYGPRDDDGHLLPAVIRDFLAARQPALTNGDQEWDYVYVEDAAAAIYAAATTEGASGVFNVAAGQSSSIRTIVETVRDLIDPTLPAGFGARDGVTRSVRGDSEHLRSVTGWAPTTTLLDGLRATVEWYRTDGR